jgi:hypothetical protein
MSGRRAAPRRRASQRLASHAAGFLVVARDMLASAQELTPELLELGKARLHVWRAIRALLPKSRKKDS